jgi:2,3-bisphosphoglycerate-independent phosphoglycerate mutase
MSRPKPVLLLILDGWGHRDDPADNAIAQAQLPNWRRLLADCPHTLIHTSGLHVGPADGQMGNSEVGHMNLGAGRIVYQDLTRVDAAIRDGSFFDNAELLAACDAVNANGGTLHVFGLLSPGGVHSHEDHLFAMLRLAARRGVQRRSARVPRWTRYAAAFGRVQSSRSAGAVRELGSARIASVSGRYFAMDRDQRWDRVQRAYDAIALARSEHRHAAMAWPRSKPPMRAARATSSSPRP